ncbi:MAG TPA: hypothetical protein PKI62_13890 [bacterium]|nr:hypothetical protein [bacterium]HPR89318.1 hypothetical protein [bacterium]
MQGVTVIWCGTMGKLYKIVRGLRQFFSVLIALFFFCDATDLDSFFPALRFAHADEAQMLVIVDNGQDLLASQAPEMIPRSCQYKSAPLQVRSRTDLDSPVTLHSPLKKQFTGTIFTLRKSEMPNLQETGHILFLELCCLQI